MIIDIEKHWPWPLDFSVEKDPHDNVHHYRRHRSTQIIPLTPWTAPYTPLYRLPQTSTFNPSGISVGGETEVNLQTTRSLTLYLPGNGHKPDPAVQVPWDHIPFDRVGVPIANVRAFLFPADTIHIRGIHELFTQVHPFANIFSPTVAEIEYWNYRVLVHLRNLLGVTIPLVPDRCYMLYAQFVLEHITLTQGTGAIPQWSNLPVANTIKTCAEQISYSTQPAACCLPLGRVTNYRFAIRNWAVFMSRLIYKSIEGTQFSGLQATVLEELLTTTKFGLAHNSQSNNVGALLPFLVYD